MAGTLYEEASAKFARAAEIDPNDQQVYGNWGMALIDWACLGGSAGEALFQQGYKTLNRAVALGPNEPAIHSTMGRCLLKRARARRQDAQTRQESIRAATQVLMRAESLRPGAGAYNLACLYAFTGDEAQCRHWLEVGQQQGVLPTQESASRDGYLRAMQDKPWFGEVRWGPP